MANQIKGNVYIVDSSGIYLTGSNSTCIAGTLGGDMVNMSISNIRFVATDSTGAMDLSYASALSTDVIKMSVATPAGGPDNLDFSTPFEVSERVYVRTLTAGTGYIYFS